MLLASDPESECLDLLSSSTPTREISDNGGKSVEIRKLRHSNQMI